MVAVWKAASTSLYSCLKQSSAEGLLWTFGMLQRRSRAERVFYRDDSRTRWLDWELMSRPCLTSSQQPNICSFHWRPLQISRIWFLNRAALPNASHCCLWCFRHSVTIIYKLANCWKSWERKKNEIVAHFHPNIKIFFSANKFRQRFGSVDISVLHQSILSRKHSSGETHSSPRTTGSHFQCHSKVWSCIWEGSRTIWFVEINLRMGEEKIDSAYIPDYSCVELVWI